MHPDGKELWFNVGKATLRFMAKKGSIIYASLLIDPSFRRACLTMRKSWKQVFDEADKKITDEEVGIKSEGGKKSQGDDKDNPAWSMIKDIFAPGSPSK